jgi:FHA domain-containing protein
MPPVKTAASSTDVDNEATAELPVLDVAAYEAALGDSTSNTDTWNVPAGAIPSVVTAAAAEVQASAESIPTLRAAEPEEIVDLGATHEMPALPVTTNKVIKATPLNVPAAAAPAVRVAAHTPPPVTLPPSPPLIEELRGALAAAERRIEELNERARIADVNHAVASTRAEAEAAQLREQLGQRQEMLYNARGRLGVQSADQDDLQDELFARADRIDTLQRELAEQSATLARVRAELDASVQLGLRLDADVSNMRAGVQRRDAQIGTLEADLVARQQREQELRTRLAEALASIDPQVPELRAALAARDAEIRRLKQELEASLAQGTEKNADLEVAEESIHNLEIEVRDKAGKLEEASVTVEEWRAVIAESQRSILERDNRIRQLEADLEERAAAAAAGSAADSAAQTGEEVALEGPARLLIRTNGNTDFVHVLGRRTRIGRGADNELVLDLKHVSRYHAVLLAGPVHTTIEDLRSTNGVFVNGKRVSRHVLKENDRVTIGKSHFRYTVRT